MKFAGSLNDSASSWLQNAVGMPGLLRAASAELYDSSKLRGPSPSTDRFPLPCFLNAQFAASN